MPELLSGTSSRTGQTHGFHDVRLCQWQHHPALAENFGEKSGE